MLTKRQFLSDVKKWEKALNDLLKTGKTKNRIIKDESIRNGWITVVDIHDYLSINKIWKKHKFNHFHEELDTSSKEAIPNELWDYVENQLYPEPCETEQDFEDNNCDLFPCTCRKKDNKQN